MDRELMSNGHLKALEIGGRRGSYHAHQISQDHFLIGCVIFPAFFEKKRKIDEIYVWFMNPLAQTTQRKASTDSLPWHMHLLQSLSIAVDQYSEAAEVTCYLKAIYSCDLRTLLLEGDLLQFEDTIACC